jgi:hypothetical protein
MEPEILFQGQFDEPTVVEILGEEVEVFGNIQIISGELFDTLVQPDEAS